MKHKIIKGLVPPAILLIFLLLPHILFLNNGYVDLEIYCVKAAAEIAQYGFNADLADYFTTVANPLLSILILGGSYRIFGESPLISRLTIFLIALAFAAFLYFYLEDKKGGFIAASATLLVIVNPMFIVYSQYVYSDIPSMVFSSAALLLLLFARSARANVISAIILGLSLATKYVAVVLFPVALIYSLTKSKIRQHFSKKELLSLARFNMGYFALALLISVPIIAVVFHFQTNILTSDYESRHAFNAGMFIPRFFSYLLWLGLFIGPSFIIPVIDLWEKVGKKRFMVLLSGLAVLMLIVNYYFPISSLHIQATDFGEMNLGWVESVVPSLYLSAAFFFVMLIAVLFIVDMAFNLKNSDDKLARNLFFWVALPIILMSFTRVANRYLLLLLVPISLYIALIAYRMYAQGKPKKLVIKATLSLHTFIFLAVGFYSNYYLYLRGVVG